MSTILEIENELIEAFGLLDSWEEKYDYLIELGQELPAMDPAQKTDSNLVKGCQSSVWLAVECQDGRLCFQADSDSLVVKGMVAVLNKVFNHQPAGEVLESDLRFFESLGLWRHLSSQRGNGLTAMVSHLKQAAARCLGQAEALPATNPQEE